MQQPTHRFRRFAAKLARETNPKTLSILKDIGIAHYHHIGRHGRCWATGYLYRHAFEALLNPHHAERPEIELDESRIEKLWIRRMPDDLTVAAFDNGWILPPSTDAVREVVDELTSLLAFQGYGPTLRKPPSCPAAGRN